MSNAGFLSFFAVAQFIIIAIVHIALALGVYRDGDSLRPKGFQTFLATPLIWAAATLIGGVIPALAYWFIHHSSLKSTEALKFDQETPPFP